MIHYLTGKLAIKKENCFILEIGGVGVNPHTKQELASSPQKDDSCCGVGVKVFTSFNSIKNMPATGGIIKVFTHLHIREDAWDIYGFLNQAELDFFVKLISVNGVGPKTALGILNVDTTEKLKVAINEGRVDLLTKAFGIGKKTSERVVVELKGKLGQIGSEGMVSAMDSDSDIMETLQNLGYTRAQAKEAVLKIDSTTKGIEDRIRAALKILKNV